MPTKRLGDAPGFCTDPDHNPPTHMVYENGLYEHICSGCKRRVVFNVVHPTLYAGHCQGCGIPRVAGDGYCIGCLL